MLTCWALLICRVPYARMEARCLDGGVRSFRFTLLLDCTSPILKLIIVAIVAVGMRS
jgi:hypothetical protein